MTHMNPELSAYLNEMHQKQNLNVARKPVHCKSFYRQSELAMHGMPRAVKFQNINQRRQIAQ